MTATKPLDIDLSLKKNNVDEFFFNLSENPEGFKNIEKVLCVDELDIPAC